MATVKVAIFMYYNRVFYYAWDELKVTFSSHLTIDSITNIDAAVAPTNTNQQAQIGTEV